jgi:hypothetical protein
LLPLKEEEMKVMHEEHIYRITKHGSPDFFRATPFGDKGSYKLFWNGSPMMGGVEVSWRTVENMVDNYRRTLTGNDRVEEIGMSHGSRVYDRLDQIIDEMIRTPPPVRGFLPPAQPPVEDKLEPAVREPEEFELSIEDVDEQRREEEA